jgi:hypothetical protein
VESAGDGRAKAVRSGSRGGIRGGVARSKFVWAGAPCPIRPFAAHGPSGGEGRRDRRRTADGGEVMTWASKDAALSALSTFTLTITPSPHHRRSTHLSLSFERDLVQPAIVALRALHRSPASLWIGPRHPNAAVRLAYRAATAQLRCSHAHLTFV